MMAYTMFSGSDVYTVPDCEAESPYLDCVAGMIERAEHIAARIDAFHMRFNGPRPETTSKDTPYPPACHRTQLDRLSGVIERIDRLTGDLEQVG